MTPMNLLASRISKLSSKERAHFFHLLARGAIMHARGLASDEHKKADLRLAQSEAIIEMLHRITEQGEHYYKEDGAQRPDSDLFDMLSAMESGCHLKGLTSSAAESAMKAHPVVN